MKRIKPHSTIAREQNKLRAGKAAARTNWNEFMLAILGVGGVALVPALLMLAIFLPVCLGLMVFWVWMLVSAIQNPALGDGEKIGWVLAIIFLQILGALLYLLIGHPKRHQPPPPITSA